MLEVIGLHLYTGLVGCLGSLSLLIKCLLENIVFITLRIAVWNPVPPSAAEGLYW